MHENLDNSKEKISPEERINLQKSYGIYYTDEYDYLQHIAPGNENCSSFCAYSHYIDTENISTADDMHPHHSLAIPEICSDSDLDDILEDHYGDGKNPDIDLNLIINEMVVEGLFNKKNLNSEPVDKSEYDKMFDNILLSYDKPIDDDNFVKFNPSSCLPPETDTVIDAETKNSIIQLAYNMSSDEGDDDREASSRSNSPPPENLAMRIPQRVYNPHLQYSNLFLPEIVSLKRMGSTTSSCVHMESYVPSITPSVSSSVIYSAFNREKSESAYEKRERKHIVKKMKSERRQIKTNNRKAFTKEITRQKKIQSVTANRKTLNY